ncbi:MAG: WD40 repeat domain-containing protein [Treponema sp.]|nr:WD40 repeat domain-containing protein [Treponema sp.]
MRKFFCAFFILFCFSLFAQEGDSADSALNPGLTEGYDNYGNFEESLPENQQKEEKDVSQDYLAKSSTAVNAVAWTHDGKYFATSWNNSIILWSAASNTIEAIYSNSVSGNSESHKDASGKNLVSIADASSIEFTSDGRYMLSVRDDNTALIHAVGSASDATLISGTGSSIPAAVYASDYKIIIALDGQNLYESYRMGNQHIIEEKLDLADGVWAVSSNPTGKRILVTSESGAIRLIDTTSWSVVSEFECYTLTRIKPRLAKDGVHFVSAKDQNTLTVTSVSDESDFYMLEDPAGFSNVAEFSVDGSKIVVGINTGLVKIFDINSGFEENSFQLMYGDSAKSLAFSPDGEYVIIGTEQGYIYRWVLNGEEFVPESQRSALQNALVLSLGYSRLNSDYYMGSAIFDVGYKNYFRPPFFWGLNANIGVGSPGSEFPFTYYEGGESLSSPFVYSHSIGGMFGLVYYNKKLDLHVFSEAGLGATVRILYNNSFRYAHASKPYFSGYGELLVGAQWKWARLWGGVQFDTNLHWLGKVHVGVAMPTRTFRKQGKTE